MQGNLDPAALLGPWERVEASARDVLDRAGGRPGHIFNLGHGVLPQTDPEVRHAAHGARAGAQRGGDSLIGFFRRGRDGAWLAWRMSDAVVLMAYGSPERLADVPAYYADIRGGRPIAPEHLDDLVERYRRLGIEESSPLNAITEQTRAALEDELGLPVFTGMKHWTPRIADAADAALAAGADAVVGLVLAPHYSALSIKGYRDQLEQALAGRAELAFVESWHHEPGFVELLADRVRGTRSHVVFTAHSLPARILAHGRPVQGPAARDRRARRRGAQALGDRGASRSRASRRRESRGSGRTSSTTSRRSTRTASTTSSSARSASSPTTSRSAGTSTSRRGEGARARACALDRIEMPNADPAFVRTLAGHRRGVRWGTVTSMRPGEIVVEHAGAHASASTRARTARSRI